MKDNRKKRCACQSGQQKKKTALFQMSTKLVFLFDMRSCCLYTSCWHCIHGWYCHLSFSLPLHGQRKSWEKPWLTIFDTRHGERTRFKLQVSSGAGAGQAQTVESSCHCTKIDVVIKHNTNVAKTRIYIYMQQSWGCALEFYFLKMCVNILRNFVYLLYLLFCLLFFSTVHHIYLFERTLTRF